MGMSRLDEHRRWRADLAAYLLGSLEPEETAALELHLEDCRRCRDELEWLRPAIAMIPESVPQLEPPEGLRARLLAEVQSDAAALSPAAPAAAPAPRTVPLGERLRGFFLRPVVAVTAVALIAAVIGGYALGGNGGSDTTTISSESGSIHASLERKGDSGTLMLTGLRRLPKSEIYEAWVQRGRGREVSSAGLFEPQRNGTAQASMSHKLDGATAVMVTVEPHRGSSRPSSTPVVTVPISD
jgi:anti-sigma-K factor RskA